MNPWVRLPANSPFVLAEDDPAIQKFNASTKSDFAVDLTLLPDPYFGRLDANVVVLLLNPGRCDQDAICHARSDFKRLARANLAHSLSEYPFYYLDPSLDTPGSAYWRRKAKPIINVVGEKAVAQGMLAVQYFPYHSARFSAGTPRVPSQEYGFDIVRDAIRRKATILIMRNQRRWLESVPELANYAHRFNLRSAQNITISQKNCPDGFDSIVDSLQPFYG